MPRPTRARSPAWLLLLLGALLLAGCDSGPFAYPPSTPTGYRPQGGGMAVPSPAAPLLPTAPAPAPSPAASPAAVPTASPLPAIISSPAASPSPSPSPAASVGDAGDIWKIG